MHDQLVLALLTAVVSLVNTALTTWLHSRNHREHRQIRRILDGNETYKIGSRWEQ